ncbi:hypothetical protein BZA05DRAFT_426945 [Tricharina praecox]|uniref:uncharacterized protein n=1 Tax=Tricharina praecox TaxID=43433 RepID=UPI00221E852C|nr:uncharacterized protein BZA05DRAFT_426945 [Tricharina praecox]KAI5845952.1 hypothetical protein BZA05DRAFT_426945 [Tricharina praecox]
MNDLELGGPLKESAEDAERTLVRRLGSTTTEEQQGLGSPSASAAFRKQLRSEVDQKLAHPQPKRWWFTSTVFPLIAGTFGPLANLFSVCALVMTWRVRIPPGQTEATAERVPDPSWLIAVNAVSLVFAIAANLLLLLNFAHRVRYAIAQPLTIVFWYISSLLLLALVVAAHKHLRLPPKNHAFSQSYYYGIISAALYFLISTLLVWNAVGAYLFKAYPPSFMTLTIPQRTLMLQTISYTLYLSLGAGIFSSLEGWSFVDGVYWADLTLLTIGFGSDFSPKRQVSQGILIPYAVGGVIMVGLVVGSVRGLFLERGKSKVRNRAIHKERKKILKDLKCSDTDWKTEFELMRSVQDAANMNRRWWGLGTALIAFLIVWFGGAIVFSHSEQDQGWTYFQSLYFTYVSLLTIGYGDYYPQSNFGKPFFVVWSLVAIPAVTILISSMGDTVVGWVKHGTLWVGQKTILPERHGKNMEKGLSSKSPDRVEREADGEKELPRDVDPELSGLRSDLSHLGHAIEHREETAEAIDPVPAEKGKHHLGARIAKEISNLATDIGKEPPRKYDWDEWKSFLELLGETEDTGKEQEEVEWKWLGDDGPLLSAGTETEWIMARLCEHLQKVLLEEKE